MKKAAPKVKALPGSGKYGPSGLYTEKSFSAMNIDKKWLAVLSDIANHGLSRGTWSSYKTALKALKCCEYDTNTRMGFPLKPNQVLTFIAWMSKRGLAEKTINVYLSGIRQCHLTEGVDLPILRTPVVNVVLEGKKHLDTIKKLDGDDSSRLPITPTLLKLLKAELQQGQLCAEDKRLAWAVATIAFNGGFRVHELLSQKVYSFDPRHTLLGQDIIKRSVRIHNKKVEILQVTLKTHKTDKTGSKVIVDVYESNGPFCPVRAFDKWKVIESKHSNKKPAFMDSSGKPLTGKKFNEILKKHLGKHIAHTGRKVTSHSFRYGIASLMGELGFADSDIMSIGRWSSRAFEDYLKLPRTKRLEMAKKIGALQLK